MPLSSAGILLYRVEPDLPGVRVLLAHPGGPYFQAKDLGAWTIPKGLLAPDEAPAAAAKREFEEELGWRPEGELAPLGDVKLRSGKVVTGFALETVDSAARVAARFAPGTFAMEWPPRSGKSVEFPEIDRVEFFTLEDARRKINPAQAAFLDRLVDLLARRPSV